MTSFHNSSQPMGTCRGTALLQLFNIVNEDRTGIVGINNVKPSPVVQHFSTPPVHSKSLLMKNLVAPNLGGSLIQCFSRFTQGVVFTFLRGEGKVEELPCLDSPDEKMPAVEKDDREVTQVEDVVPSQKSIFKFLNGDVCQLLIFLLTDHHAKVHDDVEWMTTVDAILKDYGFSGEIDENILYSPFHHWHKFFKDDPLSDNLKISVPHQCYGSENCFGIMSKLNCDAGIFGQTFKFTLGNHGFVNSNYHEETVARTPMLFCCLSSESLVPPVDKELNCVSTSTYSQSFASFSHSQRKWRWEIHDNTGCHCGNTDSLNDCGTSCYTSLKQHPKIGTTEELKFSIPDPDDLMKYLYDTISSPQFLASDPLNGESDNSQFSSLLEVRNSDEVAKSDNFSDSVTNAGGVGVKNDNEYGMFDTFGYTTESGIGATTGAFRETGASSIPSLPDTYQIEKIRWNWFSREVNSSAFDFDDHEDLLELYGLSEQDVQNNDDEFCDSPTWPGKP
ncbi:hypothetical protein CAEBREN_17262 [Caenorhabditis brenneri]|uniref:Uncharacterized protein n=1 Tax=Caenorhabditis brenneri TaxID=135651 RepID=G0NNN2_CAEBE|nr:hypothetical protein CAEBREN_17262 [Caenorhabditis brenneri]